MKIGSSAISATPPTRPAAPTTRFRTSCRWATGRCPSSWSFTPRPAPATTTTAPTRSASAARAGPGKSHASFAQLALDDCRRTPGLKGLYLRKVGKQAREQFEDLRRSVLPAVRHDYDKRTGVVTLWQDSRIVLGHFRSESEIDNYLGIEYDVILIEEATTLTESKYRALRDSNRTAKRGWRPRIYSTTNPGNIGHGWYKRRFIEPFRRGQQHDTRFVPATVDDNRFIDPGYRRKLEENIGWKRARLPRGRLGHRRRAVFQRLRWQRPRRRTVPVARQLVVLAGAGLRIYASNRVLIAGRGRRRHDLRRR